MPIHMSVGELVYKQIPIDSRIFSRGAVSKRVISQILYIPLVSKTLYGLVLMARISFYYYSLFSSFLL